MARPEKQELGLKGEGVEKKSNPAVRKAAKAYVEIHDKRMDLTKQEVAAKAVLLAAMQEAGIDSQELDSDQVVELTHGKDNVKVRTLDTGAAPEQD